MLNIHWPFALIKVTPDSSSTILLRFDNILQLPLRDFFAMFNDLMTISKIYNIDRDDDVNFWNVEEKEGNKFRDGMPSTFLKASASAD